jgi:hypothetical protein
MNTGNSMLLFSPAKLIQTNAILLLVITAGFSSLAFEGRHGDLTKTNYFDAKLNLSADLETLTDPDGGIYALKIRVHNLSRTNDVMLRLFDVPAMALSVSIHERPSDSPKWLSKPRPKLKPYEFHWVYMPLEKASTVEWFIRLSDRLSEPGSFPERSQVSLSVRLDLGCRPFGDGKVQESRFDPAWIDFFLPSAFITRKALEGDPTEKYEKSLKATN